MKRSVTLLFVCVSLVLNAQDRPFWKEISAFKMQDSLQAPPRDAIVFVGSSSFRLWSDVDQYFPGHTIINRGFGGSSLPHVITYADDIVIPYKPRQVVIYCGENDFTSDTVTSEIVTDRFKELFNLLRKELPKAEIVYVSMKPSPNRQRFMPQMAKTNEAIRSFLSGKRRATYVDIWDDMLNEDGSPKKGLFVKDMLHLNADGYRVWQEALAPVLKES